MPPNALVVGISGPSSSGKTTLARLLQRIFNGVAVSTNTLHTFIIHEDDFYYPDDQIPYTTTPSGTTIQDWDTAAAIDTNFLAQALAYVRNHGTLPPRLRSKEDQNEETQSGVPDTLVRELRAAVQDALGGFAGDAQTIAFMEGFLLYSPAGTSTTGKDGGEGADTDTAKALRPVHAQINLPLFLPASYADVKRRREGRSGYVTIGAAPGPGEREGTGVERGEDQVGEVIDMEQEDDRPPQNFWTDPPGYVDDVVWPRYVQDHAWLLVAGGTEGDLVRRVGEGTEVRMDVGVCVAPGKGGAEMEEVVRWAVREILEVYLASNSTETEG